MSDAYVAVALPLALRQTFAYAVPADLAGAARAGTRVVVPVRQREMVGVVTALDVAAPSVSARSVIAVPDPEPVLDEGLLALAVHVARHYAAPPGLVLRAMLPPTLFSVGQPVVELGDPEALPAGGAGPALARLFGRKAGVVALRRVRREAGTSGLDLVRRLAAAGAARVLTTSPRTAAPERRERVLELGVRLDSLLERERRFAKAPRQRQAFEVLEQLGGRATARQLATLGVSAAALRSLVTQGLVRAESERRIRDPFAELPVSPPPGEPTAAQAEAIAALRALPAGGAALLWGVTGSGKTLVYLEFLRRILAEGRGAIVLVPEISLTPQTVARFRGVFGDQVAVLHSALSDGERYDAWRALREGTRRVAIGPRSAVFAPVARLGAIVVDEEHDGSYKQGETPRYHAVEVALVRAARAGAAVVLGSATPALERWADVDRGAVRLVALPERIGARPLPPVEVVDLRTAPLLEGGGGVPWSEPLDAAVAGALERGEQAMVLLNRRGFSTFVQCPSCGAVWTCPACSITLTYHRVPPVMRCHHCDHREAPPTACRECGAPTQRFRGVGTQQVETFLSARFPRARIARMDVDTTGPKWSHHRILDAVGRGDVDLLVGTQMIAKGLDFPRVTVVGVVDADVALNLPDFRASERTFDLLTQVAGRAGRGPLGGRVIVQTRQAAHPAITHAARHDVRGFAAAALAERRDPPYPPHVALANVVASGPDEDAVADAALALGVWLRTLAGARPDAGATVLGPAPCPIERIRGRWRWHVLLKTREPEQMTRLVRYVAARARVPSGVRLSVDRDPVSLL